MLPRADSQHYHSLQSTSEVSFQKLGKLTTHACVIILGFLDQNRSEISSFRYALHTISLKFLSNSGHMYDPYVPFGNSWAHHCRINKEVLVPVQALVCQHCSKHATRPMKMSALSEILWLNLAQVRNSNKHLLQSHTVENIPECTKGNQSVTVTKRKFEWKWNFHPQFGLHKCAVSHIVILWDVSKNRVIRCGLIVHYNKSYLIPFAA